MRKSVRRLLPLGALLLLCATQARGQIASIEFNVPGPADWTTASNWLAAEGNFVPGDNYPQEVAGISNGGTAVLTSSTFPLSGLVLGDSAIGPRGTLRINSGGSLVVTSEGGGTLPGEVRVGAGNQGILEINGGTLSADVLKVVGATNSELRLTGNSTLAVSGDAVLVRKTFIQGPNVDFSVGDELVIGGEFHPIITGANHSAIQVPNGTAYFNQTSTVVVDFLGVTPALGQSWKLVESADTFGQVASVSSATPLPRGLALEASYETGLTISTDNRLILKVNRDTGTVGIENALGGPIAISGYSIAASTGGLSSAGSSWTSFDDANLAGWEEANPTATHLSELNPSSSTSFSVGQTRSLGSPYIPYAPTEFGIPDPNQLTFTYVTADGEVETGVVESQGGLNNLVLYVDPVTGAAAVDNQSPFSVSLDFYTIASASGSLSPTGWDSLEDQAVSSWDEASPTVTRLSELNPTGSTLFASGSLTELGNLFTVGSLKDLTFRFSTPEGTLYDGIVKYAAIPDDGLVGDTNNDGKVDLVDLNNVRNNFGGVGLGDTNGDGAVDLEDLNNVRNNFGASASAAVPEPASFALCGIALVGLFAARRFRK